MAASERYRLAPEESRAVVYSTVYRVLGTPVVAALGLVNTAVIVRETGSAVFGLVSLIATVTLLLPFADLGIGATVLSASAMLHGPNRDPGAPEVIRRAYRVLGAIAAGFVVLALVVMAFDGWGFLLGMSSGAADRWAITVAASVFALTIPAGLGVRILIGIDRNPLATLVLMSCPVFALLVTLLLSALDVDGIWYAVSSLGGLLCGLTLGTVLALRASGLGWSAFARVSPTSSRSRLLEGSGWLFVVAVGMPIGLQAGRLLLAHRSDPAELSEYALMAQIYGVCWSVLSTAGLAYWPVFVRRRSAVTETVRMWRRLTVVFAGYAVVVATGLALLGPGVTSILSGRQIVVSVPLASAFGALLVVQALYLPANVLLTRPDEARWQALWTVVMAAVCLGVGGVAAGPIGAFGVVTASVLGILVAQVIPCLLWVPRLVRRRPLGDV
ncbi:lipopolysaccharide biosynthesis protein [Rhodococcus phenolicus]|uniref:lipopolysaccharide biosynthesis protein n=1 Tax=Rhodococcus phenolicus TaxID=263849 RepID=UPI00082B924E|nr:oligosaccharide flippase family protein [Rhodococcus phenolicus]